MLNMIKYDSMYHPMKGSQPKRYDIDFESFDEESLNKVFFFFFFFFFFFL